MVIKIKSESISFKELTAKEFEKIQFYKQEFLINLYWSGYEKRLLKGKPKDLYLLLVMLSGQFTIEIL